MSRIEGMKLLFTTIEKKFGNMASLIEPQAVGVLNTDSLNGEDLQKLFHHEVLAIHVEKFYSQTLSTLFSKKFEHATQVNWNISSIRGMESSDVMSTSMPFNVAVGNGKEAVDEYFNSVREKINEERKMSSLNIKEPLMSPIDLLRLELDLVWTHGSRIQRNKQMRPYLPGSVRVMKGPTSSVNGFIHVDDLSPMTSTGGLFSANIYLKMPPTGGGLLIYPLRVSTRWQFYRNAVTLSSLMSQATTQQEKLREALPQPIRIQPNVGDLVLICAQRPHAAEGFPIGSRVSVQSFITYIENQSLKLDS